jgi:hypothetical protein
MEPNVIIWSLPTYLAAARRFGPYSTCAALAAWHEAEAAQHLLEALLVAGRTDLTVILLSDHGLRGVDHSRSANVIDYLQDLGFAVRKPALRLLYLPTMHVQAEVAPPANEGGRATVTLTCTDDDTAQPIARAKVWLLAPGGGSERAVTAEDGRATLSFAAEGRQAVLEVRHPDYNPRQISVILRR